MRRIDPELLIELESSLSEITFEEMPIGSVINDFCVTNLLNGNLQPSIIQSTKRSISFVIKTFRMMISSLIEKDPSASLITKNKILVTWIKDKKHLNQLIHPVVNRLRDCGITVISVEKKTKDQRIPEIKILPFGNIYSSYSVDRPMHLLRCLSRWNEVITKFISKTHLGFAVKVTLLEHLLSGAIRTSKMRTFLIANRHKIVLTEYDRNSYTAPLIIAAKSLNIPTATFVHGIINSSYGYTPVIADSILAWGANVRDKLITFGASKSQISIVGYGPIDLETVGSDDRIKKELGLPLNQKIVELATNPVGICDRNRMVRMFCESLSTLDDVVGIVRLHPSETIDFYGRLIEEFPGIRFFRNDEMSTVDAIAIADIVVCHNSGYALEAMSRETPVIIFDVIDHPLRSAEEYVRLGGCPRITDGAEFIEAILRLNEDRLFRDKVCRSAEEYVRRMYSYTGDDSVEQVCAFVRRTLEDASESG